MGMPGNNLNVENLAALGHALALGHQVDGVNARQIDLYRQLATLPAWLARTRRYCESPKARDIRVADWLLDNDYQVLRALRQLRVDLPKNFYRQLPALQGLNRPMRLLVIAHGALRAMPKQLTVGNLVNYVNAYQQAAGLQIAELWALPSLLRLASLENLVDAFGQLNADLTVPFAVSLEAIENRVTEPADRIAQAISSLAAVQAIEWQDFVDLSSQVERILRADPVAAYGSMSFETRDKYRAVVEKLGRGANFSETEIARKVVDYARQAGVATTQAAPSKAASSKAASSKASHVGYWLIDRGRETLEHDLAYKTPVGDQIRRQMVRHGRRGYALALFAGFLLAMLAPVVFLLTSHAGFWSWLGGLALSLLPATVLSMTLVQWLITALLSPRVLPSMDYRRALPDTCQTAVAVPVIVAHERDVQAMLEQLEIRHLSNPDPMLHFVLLSDLPDAGQEHEPDDTAIETALIAGIESLNRQYGNAATTPFYLLHRRRFYNPAESCWMGRERKRGKLEQFNQYILQGDVGEFCVSAGAIERLRDCRFVITLDADTMLPPETAAKMIGILMHPLNMPELDPRTGKVVSGYTVVQPRLEVLPLSGPVSLFCRLYAGDTAIDIYSRAVSDIYQDLFGSGIFVGKGIYDVAAFQRSLANRVPDNSILSHDLFEGIHGRTALASNIVLYENFPPNYPEYALRLHRWIRGDWQLIPWLKGQVPTAEGGVMGNDLSGLDRWKIADNLRRSLLAPALLLLFLGGWMMLPGSAWLWTLLAVATPGLYLMSELLNIFSLALQRQLFFDVLTRISERSGRWFLAITFLVSDTLLSLDAIARTLWRLNVSHQHLLQWRTAAHVAAVTNHAGTRQSTWRLMWPSSACAILLLVTLAMFFADAVLPAAPILLLWFVAPEVAIWIGRPRAPRREQLDTTQRQFLLQVARRTWHFFETFAGPQDNWLPPDNFQAEPKGQVAHRTSPTNIGLLLTSSLMAHDSGFIVSSDFVIRTRNAFESIGRLKSYRGHLLNWYNTQTLEPLEPEYVSSVDSGNLAMCLIALKQGCSVMAASPVFKVPLWEGLACTFGLLTGAVSQLTGGDAAARLRLEQKLLAKLAEGPQLVQSWSQQVDKLLQVYWPPYEEFVADAVARSPSAPQALLVEIHAWLERFQHDLATLRRELDHFCPWLPLLVNPPANCEALAAHLAASLSPLAYPDHVQRHSDFGISMATQKIESSAADPKTRHWLETLAQALADGAARQRLLRTDLLALAAQADRRAWAMDFKLLYDDEVRLLRIGHNVSTGQADRHHYDLLATEARTASYFAMAKGDAPIEHWFFLGRPMTRIEGRPTILSWNGSMFEYLMPALFVPGHRDTLLGESEAAAVVYQRRYARQRATPWGISESAFAATDPEDNYQYRAFGVPALGLRRGLGDDLVIAPYATALALSCWPSAAVRNLQQIEGIGATGIYGFIDALDYTPERRPQDRDFNAVKTYMAHHQGMILAAIGNALDDDIFVKRTMAEKSLRALEMLLQERIPWDITAETGRLEEARSADMQRQRPQLELLPWVPSPSTMVPQMHMLGNGRMSTRLSAGGGGGLAWQGYGLTRWLPDSTRDAHGYWVYIKDLDSGEVWSATRLPSGAIGDEVKTVFHPHMVEEFRRHLGLAVRLETTVAPDDDVDIRRVTIINESSKARVVEFTSYAEVTLAPPLDDERHQAFSKLFVGSEYSPAQHGLIFSRRPQKPGQMAPVLLHKAIFNHDELELTGYETDRARFVGRNDNMRLPLGMRQALSQTTGWTLDPVLALRLRTSLQPNETRSFALLTIAAESVAAVNKIAARYSAASLDWVYRDAARVTAREVSRLQLEPAHLPALQALAALLLHPHASLRQAPAAVHDNQQGQPNLWHFGVSGDLPVLLLRMSEDEPSDLLALLIKAQRYWRRTGLQVDLVVLRMGYAGYADPLREKVLGLLRDASASGFLGRAGGVHLLVAEQMDAGMCRGLEAAAYVVLDDDGVALATKLERILEHRATLPQLEPTGRQWGDVAPPLPAPEVLGLLFDNGLGGFDPDTGDYMMHLLAGQQTPAPWCNVLANDNFGTIVNESNLGFTWAVNSGENRLTPLSNDPLLDTPAEVLYLRDEVSAEFWSATPAPLGRDVSWLIRHGAGFTCWEHVSQGLSQRLEVFVPVDDPVKLLRLNLTNQTNMPRRLTATFYVEWLLGALGSQAKPHITCEYEHNLHAIIANNAWNPDFAGRIAFVSASQPPHSVTGDRYDFLGAEGDTRHAAALRHMDLGGSFPQGGDSCAGYQLHIDLAVGGTAEVVFMLGQGADRAATEALLSRYKDPGEVEIAYQKVLSSWQKRLSKVTVTTPEPALDLMLNRWLLYQSVASRLMARAGFYQASGAFGFRDQLQDCLALLAIEPERVRRQLLVAAAHQFEAGDVQHWWHPPMDRGVRTRCSDDYLWLVYVTARYVEATADVGVLDEEVTFLQAPVLRPEEHDRYASFASGAPASLFEHCCRALERMLVTGSHGLPLMGSGDWNDGMDRVGIGGRGESVWLAWFQIAVANSFAPIAAARGATVQSNRWQAHAQALKAAIDECAWDGQWFVRAFDDAGLPWGSKQNDECQIDSISQSWGVLAGFGADPRVKTAMASVQQRLLVDAGLLPLLDPPFLATSRNPGYIRAYPPGIRENGGQYNHAAAWFGLACCGLGDGDLALQVFNLLSPVQRAADSQGAAHYGREPYVLAGDISTQGEHQGCGGWSWYTGSASWAWQLGITGMLGLRPSPGGLQLEPCLPQSWGSARLRVDTGQGLVHIEIEDPQHLGHGPLSLTIDGESVPGQHIPWPGVGRESLVRACIGDQESGLLPAATGRPPPA